MRRIYESEALRRNEDNPFAPGEGDGNARDRKRSLLSENRSMIDTAKASHALMPSRLRDWAIAVTVETNRETYAPGEPVRIRASFSNRLPMPVVLQTPSPLRWDWFVDGVPEGSYVREEPEPETSLFHFDRGRTRTFDRTWYGRFKTGATEWEFAEPGEYEIGVRVNVDDAEERGLTASRTVRIE